jgi:hypothetical protein
MNPKPLDSLNHLTVPVLVFAMKIDLCRLERKFEPQFEASNEVTERSEERENNIRQTLLTDSAITSTFDSSRKVTLLIDSVNKNV